MITVCKECHVNNCGQPLHWNNWGNCDLCGKKTFCVECHKNNETEVTMGVGDGSGQLFVHGTYEAIKALQAKLVK